MDEELKVPEKPQRESKLITAPFTSKGIALKRSYNVTYYQTEKNEKKRKNLWNFGYHIEKIQHGLTLPLYSISVRLPKNFKSKEMQLSCVFYHDEEGISNDQNLKIFL